ncbi:helix-turn-helix domain-containing protein [Oceanobacillus saliphilus]|uniref:spr1629 family repressor/antitoxin n=1 Tax=Oceanobacillus saliphilus TaxID=2925834 RepID=UPI00201DB73C|nr:XRE family transcriptional regulator [Oceanobacillus saliphilus]
MFVGETLTNIRLLHGLSRSQLASELDVTEQSIWQYENGYISPSLEAINKLRTYFHVQPKYFYSKSDLPSQINEQHIAYRAKVRNSRQKTKSETVYLEFLNHITNYLSSTINYPNNIIKEIKDDAINYKNNNAEQIEMDKLIEHIALKARKSIGLTSDHNEDLLFHIEKSGAFIFEKTLGDTVDACSTWSDADIPFIILGNIKKTSVRRNFDLAHELGHLILHYKIDITDLNKKDYEQIEKEANIFAANFLLPEKEFLSDLEAVGKISNPNAYIELKKKWKVSIATMAFRAYSLKRMTYQQYRYFNASLNRNNYKEIEPLDDQIIIMKPGKVRSSFQALFEKGIRSVEDVLNYTKFELKLLAELVDIEEAFFERYRVKRDKIRVYDFAVGESQV